MVRRKILEIHDEFLHCSWDPQLPPLPGVTVNMDPIAGGAARQNWIYILSFRWEECLDQL